jgi:lathosterol oxidase
MEILNSISNLDFIRPKSDTIYQESLMAIIVAKNDPPAMMLAKLAFTYSILSFTFYMLISAFDYFCLYQERWGKRDHSVPQIDKPVKEGQLWREIKWNLFNCVGSACLAAPWIYAGHFSKYSKVYHHVEEYGWAWIPVSAALFVVVSEFLIYWAHRILHEVPLLYRLIHKPHHDFIAVDSFTGAAFHPVDAFIQGFPYFAMPFFIPLHENFVLAALLFVMCWSVSIHDRVTFARWRFVNGAGHHWIHHTKFVFNYGQVLTFMDRLFGTYYDPYVNVEEKEVEVQQEMHLQEQS